VPLDGDLCGQDPERRQPRRTADRAARQIRSGRQPHDRKGARPRDTAIDPRAGDRGHRMRRRDLFANVVAAALVPTRARAQSARMPTIGYLSSNAPDNPPGEVAAFKEGLAGAGFNEGRNVAIDYRFAEGDYDKLPPFVAELIARRVDVIAASGLPA